MQLALTGRNLNFSWSIFKDLRHNNHTNIASDSGQNERFREEFDGCKFYHGRSDVGRTYFSFFHKRKSQSDSQRSRKQPLRWGQERGKVIKRIIKKFLLGIFRILTKSFENHGRKSFKFNVGWHGLALKHYSESGPMLTLSASEYATDE